MFFTYIGFDSVSTAAEECRQSAARHADRESSRRWWFARMLYGSVALVLTGIANWNTLNNDAPVANALKMLGMNRLRLMVTAGALLGMISSLLVFQYGQARIWFAMSRDRLLPGIFSRVHPRYQTPYISTWVAGFVVGIPAGIFDVSWFADLSNIGTLFAFILVSAGVIVLRRKQPERPRGFRVPWVPLLPVISIVCCMVLMLSLPLETWMRFFVWLIVGLFIYFLYSKKRAAELT